MPRVLTPTGTTLADATTSTKGVVKLAGDLAGTADAPIVVDVDAALKDPDAGTAGLRTLGFGAAQAAPGSLVVRLAPDTSARNLIVAGGAGVVPLTVEAAAGQSASLLALQDSTGATLASFAANGTLTAPTVQPGSINLLGATVGGLGVTSLVEPLINFKNDGITKWQIGLDVANSVNDDLVIAARVNDDSSVSDIVYLKHYSGPPEFTAVGVGVTPPDATHRLHVSGKDSTSKGVLRLRVGVSATGNALTIVNSANATMLAIDNVGTVTGPNPTFGTALAVKAEPTNHRALSLVTEDGGANFAWYFSGTGLAGNGIKFRYVTGSLDLMNFSTNGDTFIYNKLIPLGHVSLDASNIIAGTGTGVKIGTATNQKIAFYNATPIIQPSGTPAAATDLASVISLANSLRASLLALGLVA